MKLVAHRGWSAGAAENSLAAFARAAAEPCVSGIELDVRRGPEGGLVVSHDAPGPGARTLGLGRALSFLAKRELELFVELKEPGIADAVLDLLAAQGVADRATVVGFPEIAASMPWSARRRARLGVLVRYPWQARRLASDHRPDVLGLGWDSRGWTRRAFAAWCALFPLDALGDRVSARIVVGVVQSPEDLDWLRGQGVEAAIADLGDEDAGLWRARMAAAGPQGLDAAAPSAQACGPGVTSTGKERRVSRDDHDRLQRMLRLPVPPDAVWREIGGFGALADWHPWVDRVEVVEIDGITHRHLHMIDGELYLERLLEEGERYYTYQMLEGGLPVDDHRATLSCVPEPDGCHVFWSAYFVPTDPSADEMMIGFYEAGLAALDDRYGGGAAAGASD